MEGQTKASVVTEQLSDSSSKLGVRWCKRRRQCNGEREREVERRSKNLSEVEREREQEVCGETV